MRALYLIVRELQAIQKELQAIREDLKLYEKKHSVSTVGVIDKINYETKEKGTFPLVL